MKKAEWAKVRVGDTFILANEYQEPVKVKVLEKDIRLYEPGSPSVWSYPYGLTKDTGTVKVLKNSSEEIMNLADLIKFSQRIWMELTRAWKDYQDAKAIEESYKATFTSKVQGYL